MPCFTVKWLYLCLINPIAVYIMAALSQMKGV
nr:MAG TPA: Photosystem II protein D1, Photosystem protein [Caudoviricetes sp.]